MGNTWRLIWCLVWSLAGVLTFYGELNADSVTFTGQVVDDSDVPYKAKEVWIIAWCTDGAPGRATVLGYVKNADQGAFSLSFDAEGCRDRTKVNITFQRALGQKHEPPVHGGPHHPPGGILQDATKDNPNFGKHQVPAKSGSP